MPAARSSAYASIKDWCGFSGMGRTKTYDALSGAALQGRKSASGC
jgi:hypothetical protein